MPNSNTRLRGTYLRGQTGDREPAEKNAAIAGGATRIRSVAREPSLHSGASTTQNSRGKGVSSLEADEQFRPLAFGERMLRNTAVCIALLLCVLAVQGIDHPIAATVSAELHNWVTMDLDESLGSLKFVQNLLPDAALVFWHIGGAGTYEAPVVEASIQHTWNENEPWLVYGLAKQTEVSSSAAGEVMSVSYSSDGTSTLRLRHSDGLETIYGNLSTCSVGEGDWLEAASVLGTSEALHFEIRSEGRSVNPSPLMSGQP